MKPKQWSDAEHIQRLERELALGCQEPKRSHVIATLAALKKAKKQSAPEASG